MRFFRAIISALFPNVCVSCGDIIPENEHLCEYCNEMLEVNDFTKNCRICGRIKKECVCNKRVFHFNGCCSPFYNESDGIAQTAMYSFKFGHREDIANFFAERMALTVQSCFSDIDFDLVTFVPMFFPKKLKRGFNQSQVLANHIGKILKLKVVDNLIILNKPKATQHKLKYNERFKNVKERYKPNKNYKLNGKTILLVDDIKTTGATLDECAKQLLLIGADKVYCVTGLTTPKNKTKKKE